MEKVISPEFRVSFPNIFEPKSFEGKDAKYSLTMLFSKETDLTEMKTLAQQALKEKWPDNEKRKRLLANPNFKIPFRDGNSEKADIDGYADQIFVTASSKLRPGVVDENIQPIINPEDFYAGCYARASLTAYAFDTAGNRGVAFGLQNLMKTKDGESFSGRSKAEDDFADFANANNSKEALMGKAEPTDNMFS